MARRPRSRSRRPPRHHAYRGAPAVAFALHAAQSPVYANACSALDKQIATLSRERLQLAHERISDGHLPALREFDLISGLTGIGTYWLRTHGDCDRLRDVLAYLVRLTEPLPVVGETLPGWWTSHGPDDRPSADWPGGHANLGMAHGIAGPLALLALAYRRGITVREHADAIQRICDWLDQWHCETVSSSWWPGVITAADWKAGGLLQHGPQRPSWCYGTPGLARAQQLAGQALDDASRKRVAEYALASCVADEMQLSLLRDASLCHGWAGLIQTTWRIAHDADPDSPLAALLPKLRIRMDHHLQRHGPPPGDGLLEGMVGICLSRRTVEADAAPVSHWDTCLLLDD